MPSGNKKLHVLVSGPPGSGKTTLAKFFKANGKNAVDADISGIGIWFDQEGNTVKAPLGIGRGINRWAEQHKLIWAWDGRKLEDLISRNDKLYLFGGATNMYEFTGLFHTKYYLEAKHSLVNMRLDARSKDGEDYNDFGSTLAQRKYILERIGPDIEMARKSGFIFLDASLPAQKIFDAICGNGRSEK